ncbi:protein of unknown function [Rhodovastum atsumiense]|nr:protein of unknown function [Rhodovastum atsumiense]
MFRSMRQRVTRSGVDTQHDPDRDEPGTTIQETILIHHNYEKLSRLCEGCPLRVLRLF